MGVMAFNRLKKTYNYFREIGTKDEPVLSYSQEGEDVLLERIFRKFETGFYVDIGAHDPIRFSNTYLLYNLGWKGLNIDPRPGIMERFNKIRPRDINLELAVSDTKELLTYYIFNEPALNGFDSKLSHERNQIENFSIIETKEIQTYTLDEIFNENLDESQKIEVLTIDVEGFDLNVLKSNNWEKYNPTLILVEILENNFFSIQEDKTTRYLASKNYFPICKTINTVFFSYKGLKPWD